MSVDVVHWVCGYPLSTLDPPKTLVSSPHTVMEVNVEDGETS